MNTIMVRTVRTGASAYLRYGYEATFGDIASETCTKKFGLQDTVNSLTLTHNRIDLASLGQVEYGTYAYGQQAASLGVGFTLSNPWIFESLLGTPTVATNTFTFGALANGTPTTPKTIQAVVGVGGSATDVTRTLKGGIVNSLGINTSIGNTVSGTMDMAFGIENAPGTVTTAASVPDGTAQTEFPYTFAHGRLKINGATIAELQDVDITFAQNASLLYNIGTNQAVDAYRQIFDVTGNFRASFTDKAFLDHTLNQIAKGTGTTYAETIGGSPELELKFTKDGNEDITITGSGLAPTDFGITGIAPVEPIFENISWRIKNVTVVANDLATSVP